MQLTDKDKRIINMLSHGSKVKEIAYDFGQSPRTIEHKIEVLKKTIGGKTQAGLVGEALRQKIIK